MEGVGVNVAVSWNFTRKQEILINCCSVHGQRLDGEGSLNGRCDDGPCISYSVVK